MAVDHVNLAVKTGEFVSIIGPSGCGKTTAMRMIAGLEQPDSGEIIIRGQQMQGVPPYERNVALVFQSFALFPHLDVLGNVEFGLRCAASARPSAGSARCGPCARSVWKDSPSGGSGSSPAVNGNASPWPAPWWSSPR